MSGTNNVEPISTLQHMQSCELDGSGAVKVLQALCASHLTNLRLHECGKLRSRSVCPTSLLALSLIRVTLRPAVLARLSQLQSLHLCVIRLLPAENEVGDVRVAIWCCLWCRLSYCSS